MEIMTAIAGAYLLYLVLNYLYLHSWAKKLTVDISLSEDYAFEGEELILTETVMNRKILPLPMLKVKFMTSRYLSFFDMDTSKISDHYYRNDLLSVMMYQKLTRTLKFQCIHRGFYMINQVDLVCSNLFFSHEMVQCSPVNITLYVYPKPVDYARIEVPFQKMLGTILTKRFINEDPFEFRSIREYQSYDGLKAVNWKSSAKTGSLKVNVFDYTSSQQVKIFLNLEPETLLKYEDLLEESIRMAASFATEFIHQGIPVSIHTNARDLITKDILYIPSGSGNHHITTLLEMLARIDTDLTIPAFVPAVKQEIMNSSDHDYLLIISSYQKEDLQRLLVQLKATAQFTWMIPINREIRVTVCEELREKIIPWETV